MQEHEVILKTFGRVDDRVLAETAARVEDGAGESQT